MRDITLCEKLLGMEPPRQIGGVDPRRGQGEAVLRAGVPEETLWGETDAERVMSNDGKGIPSGAMESEWWKIPSWTRKPSFCSSRLNLKNAPMCQEQVTLAAE